MCMHAYFNEMTRFLGMVLKGKYFNSVEYFQWQKQLFLSKRKELEKTSE